MADPRRYIGVRISEQGHRYIQLVADRDRVNYSEALRRLLAVGAKTDMEAHLGSSDGTTRDSAERSDHPLHERQDDRGDRDLNGDAGSGGVLRVPEPAAAGPSSVGDAIGHLHRAGLNPSAVTAEGDGPSAA